MYSSGDIIDNKYRVTGLCSEQGGMGNIVFVDLVVGTAPYQLVLKYCKVSKPEVIQRFNREVRNMLGFAGNSRVMQIHDHNLAHVPPYFVMQYFANGDLTKIASALQADGNFQEQVFMAMADCISELHSKGLQHRDIKPQNFIRDNDSLVLSDLGLSKEVGAGTTFTMNHEYWGTQGYVPPEFIADGFANPDASSDIFMLGKSFYNLLTNRDPMYITNTGLHPAIFHIIEKCCAVDKGKRYQTIPELKQGISLAYDVILNRASGGGRARQMLAQILDKIHTANQYNSAEIKEFVDLLASLPFDEQYAIIYDLPREFFIVMSLNPMSDVLGLFLDCYDPFVQPAVHTFSYAEVVANNMKEVFQRASGPAQRAKALELAVHAAIWANRFAAMDTCRDMVMSVEANDLGLPVATLVSQNKDSFLDHIEPAACKNDLIKRALRAAREES